MTKEDSNVPKETDEMMNDKFFVVLTVYGIVSFDRFIQLL